jgi:tRNA threonylcarbamoyladenosine biosynthesis protein TsaB
VLRDGSGCRVTAHDSNEDYSSWLLRAVDEVLGSVGVGMAAVDGYAVASGPGSFTGLRVGLTTVKAWCEVYGKPVVAVSRLEALAVQAREGAGYVAAFTDAQRGQVFGAVYQRNGGDLVRLGEEMVIAPGKFIEYVAELGIEGRVSWISPDAPHVLGEAAWRERERRGETIESVSSIVAPMIGKMGARRLVAGLYTDALSLDANYVRRSDAEIFWKDHPARGR